MFWLVIVYNYTAHRYLGAENLNITTYSWRCLHYDLYFTIWFEIFKNFLTSYVSLECLINSCDSCDTLDHVTRIDFTKNFRSNVLLLWFSVLDKLTQTLSSVTIRLLVVPLVRMYSVCFVTLYFRSSSSIVNWIIWSEGE